MNRIQITLRRSRICTTDLQKENLRGLGLRKPGSVVLREDTAAIRGMIRKVLHLVDVGRPSEDARTSPRGLGVEILPAPQAQAQVKAGKKEKAKP